MANRDHKFGMRNVAIFHSYEDAARNGAPKDKLRSLQEKRKLYGDIERRLSNGLFPEDALTALLNQITHLASEAGLSTDTFKGWLDEEAAEYAAEQAAGGFSAIAYRPEPFRRHQLDVHMHFAMQR